jgi:hypothetical protein
MTNKHRTSEPDEATDPSKAEMAAHFDIRLTTQAANREIVVGHSG